MKKIKDLWGKNKVTIVLWLILIICLIAIIVVTLTYFIGGSSSVYGDRLKDIDKYPISDTFKNEYISSLESDEIVSDVNINISGRVVYISISFNADTSLEDAKNKANASLESFSEELLSYYDINFTLKCEATENSDGFTILGAKNANGSGLVWNNNTPVESE